MRLITLPPSCAVVVKSGNLNFLEPSGPLQACNGTDLPLPLPFRYTKSVCNILDFVVFVAKHIVAISLRENKVPEVTVWSLLV